MQEKQAIPTPVAVGVAVVALLIIIGGGIWYLSKGNSIPTPAPRPANWVPPPESRPSKNYHGPAVTGGVRPGEPASSTPPPAPSGQ